ncbi:hypothetical protein FSARC_15053 [Fusarium sarcochroum]|uniref:Uncharacterized protein n=1 Tax=Fusarium sarcochroum TaxID=1208366 RepID=A0A8H4SPF9_9HYPO|nr:hypothetical protein FSARC_15053 [Fusarium sarcochroum]
MKTTGANKRAVRMRTARSNINPYYILLYYDHCHPDKGTNKMIRASFAIKDYAGVTVNIYHKPDATTVMAECDLEELPTVPSELVSLESPIENSVIPDDEYALREWMFADLVDSVPASNEDVLLSEFQAWEENYTNVICAVQNLQQQRNSTCFTPAYAASACNDYSFREIERPDSPRSFHSAPGTLERYLFTEIARGSGLHGQDVGQLGTKRDEQTVFNMKRQSTGWFHHLMSIDDKLLPGFHAGTVARLGLVPVCTRRSIKKRAKQGTARAPRVDIEDCPQDIQKIVFAAPFAVAEGQRLKQISEICLEDFLGAGSFWG